MNRSWCDYQRRGQYRDRMATAGCFCNGIFNHTSLCEFHQGKLLLHLTILILSFPFLSYPILGGTGMIRCNITNVEAAVFLHCRKFFAISYKSVIDKH